jgi:pyruvate dehydrogenase E2 component (dihydrolipoamide acetyltransferase)
VTSAESEGEAAAAAGWRDFTTVERFMARRMQQATAVPLATEWTMVDADATLAKVANWRGDGLPATVTTALVASCVSALRDTPEIAAEVNFDRFQRRTPKHFNIGVAVASERGLVVPVVRAANTISLADLAITLAEIVSAARQGSRDQSLYGGGHMTVTNIGATAVYGGNAIPNLPEIAILGAGAIHVAPVVRDGEVVPGRQMQLAITIDHRALDGITAARFLSSARADLEA